MFQFPNGELVFFNLDKAEIGELQDFMFQFPNGELVFFNAILV